MKGKIGAVRKVLHHGKNTASGGCGGGVKEECVWYVYELISYIVHLDIVRGVIDK